MSQLFLQRQAIPLSAPPVCPQVRWHVAQFPRDEERVQDLLLEHDLLMERNGIVCRRLGAELTALPGMYAAPDGMVVLAIADGRYLGCAAMLKTGMDMCVIRRLFLRRGNAAKEAFRAIVSAAQSFCASSGCGYIVFATMPEIDALHGPARELGFRKVPTCGGILDDAQGPNAGQAVYMRLDL